MSFKAAADLARAGLPANAFVRPLHHAAERLAVGGGDIPYFAFFYPPIYLLVCLPLALAPYLVALSGWLLVTGSAYLLVLRRILPWRSVGALLATPFMLDYDLLVLGVAIAWLARTGIEHGFRPYEKAALFAAFLLPLVARPAAMDWGLPIATPPRSAVPADQAASVRPSLRA